MINLNHPDNRDMLTRCKPLSDYAYLVSKIQAYQKTISVEQAINKAVNDCISENILADFLRAHRVEVLRVYLAEVNQSVLRMRLMEDGQRIYLTNLIAKKVRAGKSLEQIAAEVEETPEAIREIYEGVVKELNQL